MLYNMSIPEYTFSQQSGVELLVGNVQNGAECKGLKNSAIDVMSLWCYHEEKHRTRSHGEFWTFVCFNVIPTRLVRVIRIVRALSIEC